MPKKKQPVRRMTTEEIAKKVFPKKVRDYLKKLAHGKVQRG